MDKELKPTGEVTVSVSGGRFADAEKSTQDLLMTEAIQSRKDIARVVTDNFEICDADKNGYLRLEELSRFFRPKEEKEQYDAVYEAFALVENYDKGIGLLHNDEWGIENDGVTKKDLVGLADLPSDSDLSKQIDRALSEYATLTYGDIQTPANIRRRLEEGNPIPLAIAMNRTFNHEERLDLLFSVGGAKVQNEDAVVPNVAARTISEHDSRFVDLEVYRPAGFWKGPTYYTESYDPLTGTRYNPRWSMINRD